MTDGFPSERAGNSRSVFVHTNNTSTTIASIILVYILHTYALRVLVQVLLIRMARLHIERNKSRRKFLIKSRVDTDLRHDRSCNVIAIIHNV